MSRYLFWILMTLPWIAFSIYIATSKDAEVTTMVFLALFVYLVTVVEIRRRSVGLSFLDVLKSQVPFIGWKQRKKLYFAKP